MKPVKCNKKPSEDLFLHSTSHRTLDYTAQEERPTNGSQSLAQPLKHYLAAWDPKTGQMEVVEAKKVTLRGVVRAKQAADESLKPPEYHVRFRPILDRIVSFIYTDSQKDLCS